MKKRSPIAVALLSLVTFGIYTLFWLRDTRKELVAAGQKVLPVKILFAPLIALLTISLSHFFVKAALNTSEASTDSLSAANSGAALVNIMSLIVGMLIIFIFIPLTVYWYYRYCKAVESMTSGQVSLTMSLVLLIVLGFFGLFFIWPGIIQNEYNKVGSLTPDSFPPDRFSPVS